MINRRLATFAAVVVAALSTLLVVAACRSDRLDEEAPDSSLAFCDAGPGHKVGFAGLNPTGTGVYGGQGGVGLTYAIAGDASGQVLTWPGDGAPPQFLPSTGGLSDASVGGSLGGTIYTATVLQIDGTGTDDLDAGGARVLLVPTEAMLAANTNFPNRSEVVGGKFTDGTTWRTIAQRSVPLNGTGHFYFMFFADDYTNPDGGGTNTQTNTGGMKVCSLQVHASRLMDGGTLLYSQGLAAVSTVADSGLQTVSLSCAAPGEAQCDAGVCTVGVTSAFAFQAQATSVGLVQVQAVASGVSGYPWLWSATCDDVMRAYP